MGILDEVKNKGAVSRLTEETLYSQALREMESGLRRDGIWAKALADSDMDKDIAAAKYIKLRVQSLKDEAALFVVEAQRVESFAKRMQLQKEENAHFQLIAQAERAQRKVDEDVSKRARDQWTQKEAASQERWATNPWLRSLKSFLQAAVFVAVTSYIIWYYNKYT
jgi:hypothetical protein